MIDVCNRVKSVANHTFIKIAIEKIAIVIKSSNNVCTSLMISFEKKTILTYSTQFNPIMFITKRIRFACIEKNSNFIKSKVYIRSFEWQKRDDLDLF